MARFDPSVLWRLRHLRSACRLAVGSLCCMLAAWAVAQDEGPAWFAGGRPSEAAHQALGFLLAAEADGLAPADYDAEGLARQLAGAEALDAAGLRAFDAALTRAMRRYLADLHGGRVDQLPGQAGQQVERDEGFDPAGLLHAALVAGRLADAVHGAAPAQPDYPGLRRALGMYRELAEDPLRGGLWGAPLPPLPGRKLEPGQAWAGVGDLARRLVALGDLPASARLPGRYEGEVVAGLRAFQARHGLAADGVIGRATLAQLEVSPAHRVRQIELGLERLRWTPRLRAPRSIVVNVPEFMLRAYTLEGRRATLALQMRVIVGKALDTRTPLFAEDMRYIEFSPYWNVPPSIAQAELVPKLQRSPGYFARQGFEFVDGDGRALSTLTAENLDAVLRGRLRIRQRPGPANALGDIKFVFPNDENIYLHHTPSPGLFARLRRDFSHGCIRVEAPVALAGFVLAGVPEWDEIRIREAMMRGTSSTLRLREPLRVVLAYSTVGVAPDGRVMFYPDIYGHDAALDEALRRARP
ncbi:L,D-transpeptidase family protein [Zoogloea sp.]|uniref:L,D-transpeptidase family protein n=1 Tax=Zoogloea sp. TaxID=49181 RepID=UPI00261B1098|nr:L,D-transpeptidase family protein [uncultured Zoogloea sp.]